MEIPWILVSVGIGIILLVFLVIFLVKGRKRAPTDYYAFFWIGCSWIVIGIPLYITTDNFGFMAMGVVFLAIGLANKSKWKKNRTLQKRWKDLDTPEKWMRILIFIAVAIGVVALLIVYLKGRGI
ncbi:hypothetical protein KY340_04220 [Candidatus Woesearchaeota archaeon]|nr:hypothetical protein [Candidatus Woesearchaeota archaeon]